MVEVPHVTDAFRDVEFKVQVGELCCGGGLSQEAEVDLLRLGPRAEADESWAVGLRFQRVEGEGRVIVELGAVGVPRCLSARVVGHSAVDRRFDANIGRVVADQVVVVGAVVSGVVAEGVAMLVEALVVIVVP